MQHASPPSAEQASLPGWIRQASGGVEVEVLVQPRASRTKLVGAHDDRLKVQLAAPPVDGEANAALVEFLADAVHVAKRQVSLVRGDANRRKTVRIEGVTVEGIVSALEGAAS